MDIQIKIKQIDNSIFLLTINKNESIASIKQKIVDKTGFDYKSIRLIFQGYPMVDDICVYQYKNLIDNSIIHLIRQSYELE
jgi:hypothetical protein